MKTLKKYQNNEPDVPCVNYTDCIAKTGAGGTPGESVVEHCVMAGEIAAALLSRLPDTITGIIPEGAVTLTALHDVGKISPGFQKRYFNDYIRGLSPELAVMENGMFVKSHARISESALTSWLKLRQRDAPGMIKWAEVLGSHHEKRKKPLDDASPLYGGTAWQSERHRLIEAMVGRFGSLPENGPSSIAHQHIVIGLICVSDWIASEKSLFTSRGSKKKSDFKMSAETALDRCGWVTGLFS